MDSSNISHFFAALFVPLAWGAIFKPLSRSFLRSWPRFFGIVLALSFAAIAGKEWLDPEPALNDLAADLLGFFFGSALLSTRFLRRRRVLRQAADREVAGQRVSLRATLRLMERVERRSALFYLGTSLLLRDHGARHLALHLYREAKERANRVQYTLSGWRAPPHSEQTIVEMERALDTSELFGSGPGTAHTPAEVLQQALFHERSKFALFARFEAAFLEEWKAIEMHHFLRVLRRSIDRLEKAVQALGAAGSRRRT